jgi:hypothetical protein
MWFTAPTDAGCQARDIVCSAPEASHIRQLAGASRRQPLCAGWAISVVGSALDGDGAAGDLDLRVTAAPGRRPSLEGLENVMIWLQWFGLYRLGIRVDPGHHGVADIEIRTAADHDFVYTSWSLEAPRHAEVLLPAGTYNGLRYRRAGRHLVACRGPFRSRGFFVKLPPNEVPLRLSRPLDDFLAD